MTPVELKGQSMLLLIVVISIYYIYARLSTAQIKNYKMALAFPFKKFIVSNTVIVNCILSLFPFFILKLLTAVRLKLAVER